MAAKMVTKHAKWLLKWLQFVPTVTMQRFTLL